jgi:ribokinase
MAKILVVGSINMDLVVRVPHAPEPGETVLGGDFTTYPGGKGANQAVAASRMGGEVSMVGRVGNDDFGDSLIQTLLNDHVKTTYVIKDADAATGVAMIAVAANGENMIMVASGANMQLSIDDVNNARPLMREADIMLVQLESPLEVVTRAVELAKAYDLPVVFNPAPGQILSSALLSNVDYLTPNLSELKCLTDEENGEDAIQKLKEWGVKTLVITLGVNGVRVVTEKMDRHMPAFEVTAVDTTAAGDAFNGALAVALAEKKPLLEAVWMGLAAGALAVTKCGAQTSLPTREAVEAFLHSHGITIT